METEGHILGAVLQAKAEEGSARRRAEDDAQQRPSKRPRSDPAEVPSLSLYFCHFCCFSSACVIPKSDSLPVLLHQVGTLELNCPDGMSLCAKFLLI